MTTVKHYEFFPQRESVDLAIKLLDESDYKGYIVHVEQVSFCEIIISSFFQSTHTSLRLSLLFAEAKIQVKCSQLLML